MTATIFNTQTRTCQGFVYKWTYEPTGEYYIGIHKGNPDDGYVGSGTRFTKSSTIHLEVTGTEKYCLKATIGINAPQ